MTPKKIESGNFLSDPSCSNTADLQRLIDLHSRIDQMTPTDCRNQLEKLLGITGLWAPLAEDGSNELLMPVKDKDDEYLPLEKLKTVRETLKSLLTVKIASQTSKLKISQ